MTPSNLCEHLQAVHDITDGKEFDILLRYGSGETHASRLDCPVCDKTNLSRLNRHLETLHRITEPGERDPLMKMARRGAIMAELRELRAASVVGAPVPVAKAACGDGSGSDGDTQRPASIKSESSSVCVSKSCECSTTPAMIAQIEARIKHLESRVDALEQRPLPPSSPNPSVTTHGDADEDGPWPAMRPPPKGRHVSVELGTIASEYAFILPGNLTSFWA